MALAGMGVGTVHAVDHNEGMLERLRAKVAEVAAEGGGGGVGGESVAKIINVAEPVDLAAPGLRLPYDDATVHLAVIAQVTHHLVKKQGEQEEQEEQEEEEDAFSGVKVRACRTNQTGRIIFATVYCARDSTIADVHFVFAFRLRVRACVSAVPVRPCVRAFLLLLLLLLLLLCAAVCCFAVCAV